MEYSDIVPALKLVTKSQLSSLRMAIDVGIKPVATVAGFPAVKLPETGLMRKIETELEPVPKT